ncbi:MAG TPA: DNA translocase FtsK [Blastocatellia bacterium]|nr:DNA translocase FtsK [Blastocatellia bacterium]
MAKAPSARLRSALKSGKSEAKSGRAAKKGPTLTDEIIGLALAALGFIALLSLISYHSDDPSWRVETGRSTVHNWIGPVGANLSAWLYEAFGLIALLVPFVLFVLAWWRIREARLMRVSGIRIMGLMMVIGSLAGLMSVVDSLSPNLLSFHLGGLLGHFLVQGKDWGLARLLNTPGAAIALFVVLVAGLLMATPLSLVAMAMQLTPREQEAGLWTTMMSRFREWREHRAAERARRQAEDEISIGADDETESDEPKGRAEKSSRKAEVAAQASATAPAISKAGEPVAASTAAASAAPVAKSGEPNVAQHAGAVDELLPNGASSRAGTQNAAGRSAAAAASGTAARTAQARQGTDDDSEDESLMADGAESQRSVEEMVATAEVKRSEPADDDLFGEKPKPVARGSLSLVKNVLRTASEYKLPPVDMLTPPAERHEQADTELMDRAIQLAEKCKEFNVSGQVKHICPGPVVTTFEFKPDPGVKYSRVTSLVDDLCLGLKAESIRIDRIPGKSTVGIEVPNDRRETIRLREVIESKRFRESESKLTLALGKTIDGLNYVADLAKMPHLLIAGATGAGKSVALNSILVSLLYKATPDEVKLILVDPKRLELGLYADIPHLITPIVTDPKRASYALRWAVSEMENRYKHLAAFGVRNIDQYNNEVCATVDRNLAEDSPDLPTPLPYIVVVIDELADLMMVAARDVEESITRLAQMARAVGIHLILATQRPSVDVITGLIKANFPSRISFRVSSKVDSRTIIDSNGAEALLGQGDMLFLPPGTSRLVRVHGAFVDEKEVKRIAEHARAQGKPDYDNKVQMSEKEAEGDDFGDMKKDEKYEEALRIVIEMGRASTSVLQRRLRIGYGRAASIIDMMYRDGIVGPEDGSKPRAVLVKADFLDRLDQIRQE